MQPVSIDGRFRTEETGGANHPGPATVQRAAHLPKTAPPPLEEQMAREQVHGIYRDAVRTAFLDRDTVRGATDADMDRLVSGQQLDSLPAAADAVLRLVGGTKGPWFLGESLVLADAEPAELKEEALDCYTRQVGSGLADAHGMLVLTCHDGTRYEIVDGRDLTRDDPPVWLLDDTGRLQESSSGVTRWFSDAANRVVHLSKDVARRTRQQRPAPPWARYFTISAGVRPGGGQTGDARPGPAQHRDQGESGRPMSDANSRS